MSDCDNSDNDDVESSSSSSSYEYCYCSSEQEDDDDDEYSYEDDEEDEHYHLGEGFCKDSSSGKFIKRELADTDIIISSADDDNEEITELISAGLDARSIVDTYQGRFVAREEEDDDDCSTSWSRVSDHDALSFVHSMISHHKKEEEEEASSKNDTDENVINRLDYSRHDEAGLLKRTVSGGDGVMTSFTSPDQDDSKLKEQLVMTGMDALEITESANNSRFTARSEDGSWSRISEFAYSQKMEHLLDGLNEDDYKLPAARNNTAAAPAEVIESLSNHHPTIGDDFSAVTMMHDWDDASIATTMTNQQGGADDASWDVLSRMSAIESNTTQQQQQQQQPQQPALMLDFSVMSHQTTSGSSSYMMPPSSVLSSDDDDDYSSVAISTWSMVDGKVPCKRCTFLNEPKTQLCTLCEFALDANPSLTVDEQLALQMQRREESLATSTTDSNSRGMIMLMEPLERAQRIADNFFQFVREHNLCAHVFAKQLDLQFLISSSWLRWREEQLQRDHNTVQKDISSVEGTLAASGVNVQGDDDLNDSLEAPQMLHGPEMENNNASVQQSSPGTGGGVVDDVKAAVEAAVAQQDGNFMPWIAYATSTADPETIASNGFPHDCKVIISTELPTNLSGYHDVWLCAVMLGKAKTNFVLGKATPNSFSDGTHFERLTTNQTLMVRDLRRLLLRSGAQCLPLLCFPHYHVSSNMSNLVNALQRTIFGFTPGDLWETAKNAVDMLALRMELGGQKDPTQWSWEGMRNKTDTSEAIVATARERVGNKEQQASTPANEVNSKSDSSNRNEAAADTKCLDDITNDMHEQQRTQWFWERLRNAPNSQPVATAGEKELKIAAMRSRRHHLKSTSTNQSRNARPISRNARPRLDPKIFTITENEASPDDQGTVEATREENLLVYFKQGQLVSTLIAGEIKIRAVECPNQFTVAIEGVDVFDAKPNPYHSMFLVAADDLRKFKVKLATLRRRIPLMSYSCQRQFSLSKLPLNLKIRTSNLPSPFSTEPSDGGQVYIEIDCESNLRGHSIHDLAIEIDYSRTPGLKMQTVVRSHQIGSYSNSGLKKAVFRVDKFLQCGESHKISALFSHKKAHILPSSSTFHIKAWFSTVTWDASDSQIVIESEDNYKVSKNKITKVVHTEVWRHDYPKTPESTHEEEKDSGSIEA